MDVAGLAEGVVEEAGQVTVQDHSGERGEGEVLDLGVFFQERGDQAQELLHVALDQGDAGAASARHEAVLLKAEAAHVQAVDHQGGANDVGLFTEEHDVSVIKDQGGNAGLQGLVDHLFSDLCVIGSGIHACSPFC